MNLEIPMKEKLEQDIADAKRALQDAEAALLLWTKKAENNVFATLEDAEGEVEEMLRGRAHEDCEGSYNCGAEVYDQEFMVDGVKYVGTLKCEYNRHDKTYYYLEEADFSVEKVG